MSKSIKVSKEKAIELAMNHNGVTRDVAERYTLSELREVVKHASGTYIKLVPNF
jgi:hypothetical protein